MSIYHGKNDKMCEILDLCEEGYAVAYSGYMTDINDKAYLFSVRVTALDFRDREEGEDQTQDSWWVDTDPYDDEETLTITSSTYVDDYYGDMRELSSLIYNEESHEFEKGYAPFKGEFALTLRLCFEYGLFDLFDNVTMNTGSTFSINTTDMDREKLKAFAYKNTEGFKYNTDFLVEKNIRNAKGK